MTELQFGIELERGATRVPASANAYLSNPLKTRIMPLYAGDRLTLRQWLPPLLWAAVIVFITSVPGEMVPREVSGYDKAVHFTMYAVLGWLLTRHSITSFGRWVAPVLALALASGFAAMDEWHQQYIPGRDADLVDWQADSAGATLGAVASAMIARRRTRTANSA